MLLSDTAAACGIHSRLPHVLCFDQGATWQHFTCFEALPRAMRRLISTSASPHGTVSSPMIFALGSFWSLARQLGSRSTPLKQIVSAPDPSGPRVSIYSIRTLKSYKVLVAEWRNSTSQPSSHKPPYLLHIPLTSSQCLPSAILLLNATPLSTPTVSPSTHLTPPCPDRLPLWSLYSLRHRLRRMEYTTMPA